MTRKTSIFIFIGLIVTFVLWMFDRSSLVTVNWRETYSQFSIPEAMLFLLVLFAVIDLITRIVRTIIRVQLKEVYRTSVFRNGTDENATIDVLAGKITDKMILNRRDFDNSMLLVLRAMTSITAGDMKEARVNLSNLKKIIGDDPIIDVLKMKIYKGEKDFDHMEKLSAKLMKNESIQLIGMKAAVEAQMQKKEFKEALATVNRAYELRQDLYWVIESAFELRAKAKDWEGAMQVLDAGLKKKMVSQTDYKRYKSIVLLEMAKDYKAKKDEVNFFKCASQSLEADSTLVPAALELARYYKKTDNQYRKAAKVLTETWKRNPVDELAYEYLKLFPKESVLDQIQRLESFTMLNSLRPSLNNRLIAELTSKAGLWTRAKSEVEMFLINNPCTKEICRIAASFEEKYSKDKAAAKEWKKRTGICANDSAWVCEDCGHASQDWEAVCPNCGSFGREKWHLYVEDVQETQPAEVLTSKEEDDE